MPYTRSFSTLGCAELDLAGVFGLASRHGIPGVELRALAGTTDLPKHFAEVFKSPDALHEFVGAQDIKILSLDTSLWLADASETARESFLAFVPWAEAIGTRWLRVFDGKRDDPDEAVAAMASTIRWWRELRAANGWTTDIMIETHDSLFTSAQIARIQRAAPGVAILWDSHHTWKRGGEDPLSTWRAIRENVVHIHVKDSVTTPESGPGYTYVLPGAGEFPMGALRGSLASEFDGAVSLEWEKLWVPELAPLDEVLTAATGEAWW